MTWAKRSPRSTSSRASSGRGAAPGVPSARVARSLFSSTLRSCTPESSDRPPGVPSPGLSRPGPGTPSPPRQREIVLEVGLDQELSHLLELVSRSPDEVTHRDRLAILGGQEGGGQDDVADVAPGDLKLAG